MRIACLNQDAGIRPGRKKGAAVHLDAMRQAFRKLGADVLEIDVPQTEEALQRLRRCDDEAPLSLVYERFALGGVAGARFSKERHIPLVLEVNAPLMDEARRFRGGSGTDWDATAERSVLRSASKVIVVSNAVRQYVLDRGVAPEVVDVRPNGVDLSRFRPRASTDSLRAEIAPADHLILGFHGRLRPWHGAELLAAALQELWRRGVPAHLLFVGVGGELLEDMLREHAPPDSLTILDWVPNELVSSYVACFDILPLTYGSDLPCYFSPLKLAEGMACGAVPVYPPIGDLESVLEDGVNAAAYRTDDVASLADVVTELWRDEDARKRLSSGALRTAARMGWDRIAEEVLECARARPRAAP